MPNKNQGLKEFFAFITSRSFLQQILIALAVFIILFLVVVNGLALITRHGEELEVPNVINMQLTDATHLLVSRSFKVQVDSVFVNDKPGGMVIDQSPVSGDKVKEGRSIYLTMVTYQAPEVHLPKFEDIAYKEYVSDLESVGISVENIVYKSDIARDLVLGVTFKNKPLSDNIALPKGSKVDLILGDGNGGTVVLPSLVGLSLDDAKFAIRGAQLFLGHVSYDSTSHDTLNAKVYRQSPSTRPDTVVKVSQGTLIDLYMKTGGK